MSSVPSFVPDVLLDRRWASFDQESDRHLVESQLLELNAWEAKLEFMLGAAFEAFTIGEARLLGHHTMEDFARARLGFTWSHARELRDIRVKLRNLPILRRAFLHGELRRTRLREVLRVATPETETQWLTLARALTRKELRECVKADVLGEGRADVARRMDEEDAVRVAVPVTPKEFVFLETVALPMVRSVVGQDGPRHALIEALAAETLTERPVIEAEEHDDGLEDCDGGACKPKVRRISAARAKRQAQRVLGRAGGEARVDLPRPENDSLEARLARVLKLAQWLRGVDWQRARLLDLVTWWSVDGTPDFATWAWRRFGIAPREVVALRRMTIAMQGLRELESAWRDGRITRYRAERLTRFASAENEADWVRFAEVASGKRFDLEVDAVVAMQVALGVEGWKAGTDGGRPCWDVTMTDLRVQWALPCADAAETPEGGWCNSLHDPGQLSPGLTFEMGARSFVFHAPKATAESFHAAMRLIWEKSRCRLEQAQCLLEMVRRFAAVHVSHALADRSLRARILRRDGWQCSMPHCRNRRHLHVHHVKFRSRLGGNEPGNLVTLCTACHRLVHEERITLTVLAVRRTRAGLAPELAVAIGAWEVFREGLPLAAERRAA